MPLGGSPRADRDAPTRLRDRDIRAPLHNWLTEQHLSDPDTKIIHEFEVPRPSARVDIAMINGRLAGYEIKSEADTFARLPRQEHSFSQVFEKMTLVVATKHLAGVHNKIPDWWGLIQFEGNSFRVKRAGRLNPNLDIEKLLFVLTRAELNDLERALGRPNRASGRKKEAIIANIVKHRSKAQIREKIRALLKKRPD